MTLSESMPLNEKLFSIGEFAQVCRLSIKQLRRYDELGLLTPAFIDPDSGYRYYAREQIRAASTIALLRDFDLPLSEIPANLGDQDKLSETLANHQQRLELQLERYQNAFASVTRILQRGLHASPIELQTDHAIPVVAMRRQGSMETIGRDSSMLITDLLAQVQASNLRWSPSVMGLYPVDFGDQAEIGACVQCSEKAQHLPQGCYRAELPGSQVVTTIHVGSYSELRVTYNELFVWVYEHQLQPYGLLRETYLDDPRTTAQASLRTRIAIPVKQKI